LVICAGTIKRGQNKKEDENNEKTLMKDEKELSEHRMLVDLVISLVICEVPVLLIR
jgi:anthranilate/para-aminobenzoate synthase component I